MASTKMKAMRLAKTPAEAKLKGLKPWRSIAWQREKRKKRARLMAQMEAGHERREARRKEKAARHEAMLKEHAAAKKA